MESNLTINLIPFGLSFDKVKIYYSNALQKDYKNYEDYKYNTITKRRLNYDSFKDSNDRICWDLNSFKFSESIEIEKENFNMLKSILKKILSQLFFRKKAHSL